MKTARKKRTRRILIFVISLLSLAGLITALFVISRSIPQAGGWYNPSWMYRKGVTVNNTGGTLTNNDVLLSVNTSILISSGKLQSNCNDLRFLDSNDSTLLSYWIEGGCNTTTTQVWVRIPSIPTGGKTIYMYYGNASASSAQAAWSGNFILMSNSSCASGWTRNTSFDNRFPYGSSTYGTTGGSSSHNHANFSVTSSGATQGRGCSNKDCGSTSLNRLDHTHQFTGSIDTNSNVWPPYINTYFCQSSALDIKTGHIALFTTLPASGWTRNTAIDNRMPRGANSYGTTGGSETHNHTLSGLASSAGGAGEMRSYANCSSSPPANASRNDHTHASMYGTVTASNNVPPYMNMIFGMASSNTTGLSDMITMSTAIPPLGWNRYSSLDSRIPRGNSASGATGGTTTHTHPVSVIAPDLASGGNNNPETGSTNVAHHVHGHTASFTSSSSNHVPPYLTVLFIQRKSSVTSSFQNEEVYNQPPSAPTSLQTIGETNPTGVTDLTPNFSAVFNDPDTNDTAIYYQIHVNTLPNFSGTTMWISGKQAMEPLENGQRSPDITYDGTPLSLDGSTYYWLIQFWDNNDTEGDASDTASFTMNTSPNPPEQLQVNSQINPEFLTDTTPQFSALYTDPDSDSGVEYQIQVNTGFNFEETVMWDSGRVSMNATDNNTRTEEITYSGTEIQLDGSIYYWRMRVWDQNESISEWSDTNFFKMNNIPDEPSLLRTNELENPTQVTTLQPEFSAVFSDSDSTDTATHYEIQVNTTSSFFGTVVWESEQTPFETPVLNGERSESITYNGTQLQLDGTIYYWRIRFWDTHGTPSSWSPAATFKMLNVPNPVTELTGTPISTTSIRWSFTDNTNGEEGVMLYDQNNVLRRTCTGQNLTHCDEYNLSENTQYFRYVVVYNSEAQSTPSETADTYTLISVPEIQYTGEKTDTTISLSATQPANGGELYFDCTGQGCDNGLNTWTTENIATVTGLSNNTPYTFRVKARNGNNVETSYSSTITIYTHASIPTLSANQSSTTAISLSASGLNNILTGNSGLLIRCIDTECNTGINEWITIISDTAVDLQPNTQYTFRAKARNFDGNETEFSEPISTYTLAVIPSVSEAQPVNSSEISLSVSNRENPGTTEILIQETYTGKYLNLSTGQLQALPYWGQNNSPVSVIGLNSGTTYTFKVKARNGNNIETEFSPTLPATTFLTSITAAEPTVDSSTQITWNISEYSDEILGVKLYTQDGTIVKTCLGTDLQSCTESSLSPNTIYQRKMKIYNNIAESNFTNTVSAVTLANVPSIQDISVGKYTSESVHLNIDTNSNSESTRYLIQEKNTQRYMNSSTQLLQDTPYYSTYSQLGSSEGITIYGLEPNTQYIFRIKALNNDSVETEYSSEVTVVTLANQASVVSVNAIDSTSVRVVLNNSGNNSSTLFRLIESNSNQNINPSTATFDSQQIWRTHQDFGANNGITVSGLQPNTRYSFCIMGRNSQNIQTQCSQTVSTYTYSRTAGIKTRVISSSSIEISIDKNSNPANTRYQIVDTTTNGNIDSENRFTSSTVIHDDSRVNRNFTISNLPPNTTYSFRVRTVNSDNLFSAWSDTVSVTTWANSPTDLLFETIGGSTGRIKFNRNGNPTSTRYAIQESNSGKYLDYTTMQLTDSIVWGTYNSWGAANGILIRSLDPGVQYIFKVKAINSDNVETSFVESSTGKTYSIIVNKPGNISTILAENSNIDVSNAQGAQTGIQKVRILNEQFIVADIPISFENNRDWSNAIILVSPTEGKTVVKLDTSHGLTDKFTMYVVKNEKDNAFRICPEAKSLEEVNSECNKGVLYTGVFPQTKKVEGANVVVSQASISGTTYWIADGLQGTGGQGEFLDSPPSVIPGVIGIREIISSTVQGAVTKTVEILDTTPLGNIKTERLTTVSATATVVTVSVGILSAIGGIGQIGYTLSQVFITLLSLVGFRRKRYPSGYVYNSITREPVHQVIVRIYDLSDKLIETGVTDRFGLFRTSLETGEYKLSIKKRGYLFPSKLIIGKDDYPLSRVYHGEKVFLRENEVNVVIPIDPIENAEGQRILTVLRGLISSLLPFINLVLFTTGLLIALYVYIKAQNIENIAILTLYIPTTYVLVKSFTRRRKTGKVVYTDGKPAPNIALTLREKDFNKVITKRVTDKQGRYSFDIPEKGEYIIESMEKGIKIVEGRVNISSKGRKIVNVNLKVERN